MSERKRFINETADKPPEGGWIRELSGEKTSYNLPFVYRIPKSEEALGDTIGAAVFNVFPYELKPRIQSFTQIAEAIDDPSRVVTEETFPGTFKNFPEAVRLAQEEAQEAVDVVLGSKKPSYPFGYRLQYDRQVGPFIVAQGYFVEAAQTSEPGTLLVTVPAERLLRVPGLPAVLMRRWTQKKINEELLSVYPQHRERLFAEINAMLQKVDLIGSQMGGSMKTNLPWLLYQRLMNADIRRFDSILNPKWTGDVAAFSAAIEKAKEIAPDILTELTPKEAEPLVFPEKESETISYNSILGHAGELNLSAQVTQQYAVDPQTRIFQPVPQSLSAVKVDLTLKPEITSRTTHTGLMKLRSMGLQFVQDIHEKELLF